MWEYETGTFHMLTCAVIAAKAFPKESGKISFRRLDFGKDFIGGTLQTRRVGDKYRAVETTWTMATVTGKGKSVSIFFPITLFVELIVYHNEHRRTIRNASAPKLVAMSSIGLPVFPRYRHVIAMYPRFRFKCFLFTSGSRINHFVETQSIERHRVNVSLKNVPSTVLFICNFTSFAFYIVFQRG